MPSSAGGPARRSRQAVQFFPLDTLQLQEAMVDMKARLEEYINQVIHSGGKILEVTQVGISMWNFMVRAEWHDAEREP